MIAELSQVEAEVLPYYLSRDSWHPLMVEALEETLAAFAKFLAEPVRIESQRDAASAIARLEQIKRDLSALPPRRPYILDLKADQAAAACLVRMADCYLDAFEASMPLEAQSHARHAQSEIDAATEVHRQAEHERDLGNQFSESDPQSFVQVSLQVVARTHPEKNLFEIDAEVRPFLERRFGRNVAPGQGVSYAIAETLAKSALDVERFRSVVSETSKLIDWDARLDEVAGEPGALAALRRAREAIFESTVAFAAALSTATTDEARLRRTLNLYRELFEDAGLPLFAWVLRISGVRSAPFAKLLSEDSTALLAALKKRPELERIFLGADKNIRTAASHGFGYNLDGQDVVFKIRSFSGTMTVEVLIDLLLALLESFLAVFWVLDNELAALDLEGHIAPGSVMGAPMLLMAEEVLKHMGATVLAAEDSDKKWKFVLASGASSTPFVYAGALASNPPDGVDEISVECPDLPNGELRIPRETIVRFVSSKDSPPMGPIIATMELLSGSTIDGHPALTADHLRSIACVAAVALLDQNNTKGIQALRGCLRKARALEAADVIRFSESTLSEWRSSDPARRRNLQRTMLAWTSLPVPALPTVRVTQVVDVPSPKDTIDTK